MITWGVLPRRAVLSQLVPEFHLISPTSVAGKALTRLCVIIDFETPKVVYDRLVEPPAPIRDHLTRCVDNLYPPFTLNHKFSSSSITVEILDPITTSLADVQAFLQSLITPSTILLATHSNLAYVNSNSRTHGVSTLLLSSTTHAGHHKPGLVCLTRKWFDRTIQDRRPGGHEPHDPEEDARACVELLNAKI